MSLNTILKEMEVNQVQANVDVTLGNPSTYNGRVGLKRAATETLKRLKRDYRNELVKSIAFIVVTGNARDQFTQLASSESFGCFSADPEDFFKTLTSKINPSLFGREGPRQLFSIAGNILEDLCLDLDINSYPALSFNDRYNTSVKTAGEFLPVIRNAIVEQVGSEVVGINAISSILDTAITKKHDSDVTPVVLNTADEKFALDLQKNLKRLTSKVFLVVAGKAGKELGKPEGVITVKTTTEETVGEALATIRSKL